MPDDFKARVDRVFGSLFQSIPSVQWTLSDDAVERREWNREESSEERDETPSSSCFDGFRRKPCKKFGGEPPEDPEHDDDDGDDEADDFDRDDEDGQVLSSIGMDSTLDQEAEEDEYDKVAVGKENQGDRVYMNDVNHYGPGVNYHNVLPDSLEEGRNARKDPRANHVAARARLREDDQDAPSSFSCNPPSGMLAFEKQTGGPMNVKSILKRKEGTASDPKPRKRVRFDPVCNTEKQFEGPHGSCMGNQGLYMATQPAENDAGDCLVPEGSYGVPDYVRNPSKYVCYTLDWSTEDNDASNLRAFQEFCKTVKPTTSLPEEDCRNTTKSITFIPRKRSQSSVGNSDIKIDPVDSQASCLVGIAAGETKEGEACAMDEDQLDGGGLDKDGVARKVRRQYRSRVSGSDEDAT